MPIDRADDPRAFRDFLDAQLADGGQGKSLDELLDLWHYENSPAEERQETLQAIRRGLDDMHAGRTVDAFESAERIRQKIESMAER